MIDPYEALSVTEESLKAVYAECCELYRTLINKRWDMDVSRSWWSPRDVPGVVLNLAGGEYSLSMDAVRILVDMGVTRDEFEEWWQYNMKAVPKGGYGINAYSWFVSGSRPEGWENKQGMDNLTRCIQENRS